MKKALLCICLILCVILSACDNVGTVVTTAQTDVATTQAEIDETTAETTIEATTEIPDIEKDSALPISEAMGFEFSSGAGAWRTALTLKDDNTFFGEYHDSNMGEVGEGYPNGTCYICNFDGRFKDIKKVNDYTYSMSVDYINTDYQAGTEWIEDGVLYIASRPYGLDGDGEFLFYTPDAPTSALDEYFLLLIHKSPESSDTLGTYAIHNLTNDEGFVQQDIHYGIEYSCQALSSQFVNYVMSYEWLNEEYEITDLDAFRFISSLVKYCDDASHPFGFATTLNEEESAFCIDRAYALNLISTVFGIDGFESSDYHTTMHHPKSDTYRTPYGIGLYSSPFSFTNMTSVFDGEYVYVSFTLENSKLYPYEEKVYGDYTFVFDTEYKLVEIKNKAV